MTERKKERKEKKTQKEKDNVGGLLRAFALFFSTFTFAESCSRNTTAYGSSDKVGHHHRCFIITHIIIITHHQLCLFIEIV